MRWGPALASQTRDFGVLARQGPLQLVDAGNESGNGVLLLPDDAALSLNDRLQLLDSHLELALACCCRDRLGR